MNRSLTVGAGVLAGALLLAACGGDDTADSEPAPEQAISAAAFNQADVTFAQGMIPHHSQAVDMAELALARSENPAILDLAGRIRDAQDPEIEQMRALLATWGEAEMDPGMEGMDDMDGMSDPDGMMGDEEIAALESAAGPDFDRLFVDMMVRHHQGAIVMAETVLDSGSDPEVQTLAEAIIAAQTAEIDEMQGIGLEG
jgi:uncharacterized protein (DUF305 family)